MITQRFVGNEGTMTGQLTISTIPDDANSYAELLALREELKLRVNIKTEGSIITTPPVEDIPPPPA
jgi:hypothetical protein